MINSKLISTLFLSISFLVVCDSGKTKEDDLTIPQVEELKTTHLRYDILIIEISEKGIITNFTQGCKISKRNPFNLKQVTKGDTLEHKDRLWGNKECSITIKIGDKVFEKGKHRKGFDYVFHIKDT